VEIPLKAYSGESLRRIPAQAARLHCAEIEPHKSPAKQAPRPALQLKSDPLSLRIANVYLLSMRRLGALAAFQVLSPRKPRSHAPARPGFLFCIATARQAS
jgi:hypothetical protein